MKAVSPQLFSELVSPVFVFRAAPARGSYGNAGGSQERVIDYLVARDMLLRAGGHLVSGSHFSIMDALATAAETTESFVNERAAIDELHSVKVTAVMLESA